MTKSYCSSAVPMSPAHAALRVVVGSVCCEVVLLRVVVLIRVCPPMRPATTA